MTMIEWKDQFRDHPTLGFVDWVLRGIGQVVFQNNPISGAVILGAIFYNSWIYGIVCLFGTVISTLTALWLKADKGMIKDGLFGFNGALIAIALVAYTSKDFTHGNLPNGYLWLYIVLCAVFTSVLVPAFAALLGPHKVPGLTMPFVLATWFFLGALLQFTTIDVSTALKPTSPADFTGPRPDYTWVTWFHGITDGHRRDLLPGQLGDRSDHADRDCHQYAGRRAHGALGLHDRRRGGRRLRRA